MAAPTAAAGACWALWTDDGLFCVARFCDPPTLAAMMRACRRWHASLRGVFMHLSSYQNVPSTWSWRNAASRPGRVLFARLELGLWNSGEDLGCYPNVTVLHIFKGDRWWEWERRHRKEDELVAIASAFPNVNKLTFCCPYIPGRSKLAKIWRRLRIVWCPIAP